MLKSLRHKLQESISSVLAITLIVLVLSMTIVPLPLDIMLTFILGAIMLIAGMSLFSAGVDMAMTPMGEAIGSDMTRTRRVWLVLLVCLLIGTIVTVAEPDLSVLANQVSAIPNLVLILTIAIGVGIFLVIAVLRILFRLSLQYMLLGFYLLVLLFSLFAPSDFIPLAFDSGGVTTGPITVPFILAMGIGIATIRGDRESHEDSFGLVALCSIGPILMVLLLGIFYKPSGKEIISILTPAENRIAIMQAINEKYGLRSDAKAMVLSLPVEDLVQVH